MNSPKINRTDTSQYIGEFIERILQAEAIAKREWHQSWLDWKHPIACPLSIDNSSACDIPGTRWLYGMYFDRLACCSWRGCLPLIRLNEIGRQELIETLSPHR